MTAFYKDLYAFLQNFEAVTELVATRLHPLKLAPDAATPAIVASRISTIPMYSHDGINGKISHYYQIRTWAETFEAANALADILEGILNEYRGKMGSRTLGAVFLLNRIDGVEPKTGLYSQILDYQFCES